ncbi:MAG: hypothetical protein LUG90_17655, partial [Clostridiaceae bacterium]|nr:hypothetical protein [Clostridiaceae bacterium]
PGIGREKEGNMKIPKKYQNRIYDIYNDDGWWCELNEGWCYDQQGQHIIHEDTKTEILKCIGRTEICHCNDCRQHTGFVEINPDGVEEF